MPAANTDKFLKGARKWSGQIGGGGIADAVVTSFSLASTTNLPTDTAVQITVDRVDSNGTKTPSKEEVIRGVVSGSNIISCVRGVAGTAQAHQAGAVVEIMLTADAWNRHIDGILAEHNADGTHKSALVTTLKGAGSDIDAGTEDAKIVTPKSIMDSFLSKATHSLFRQFLINGNFDVWQRGTSFSTSGVYTADRWKVEFSSGTNATTQDTDVPDILSKFSHKIVQTSFASGGNLDRKYRIEGSDARRLSGKTITITLWHKESVTAGTTTPSLVINYASALDNFTTVGDAFASPSSITFSGSWVKHTYTVTLPATSNTGGYSIANGIEIVIRYTQSVATGTLTSNIAQVQMCEGPIALPFLPKSYREEEAACLRYWNIITCRNYSTTTYLGGVFTYPVPMRTTPTVTYTDSVGNASKITNNGINNVSISGGAVNSINNMQMQVDALIASAVGNWWSLRATSDAEL